MNGLLKPNIVGILFFWFCKCVWLLSDAGHGIFPFGVCSSYVFIQITIFCLGRGGWGVTKAPHFEELAENEVVPTCYCCNRQGIPITFVPVEEALSG